MQQILKHTPVITGFLAATLIMSLLIRVKSGNDNYEKTFISPVGNTFSSIQYIPQTIELFVGDRKEEDFEALVKEVNEKNGTYGIFIHSLKTDKTYTFNEKYEFYAASLYKTPVAIAVYSDISKGRLSQNLELEYLPSDFSDGSGTIPRDNYNATYTVKELLNRLLKDSDNVAQNILVRNIHQDSLQSAFIVPTQNPQTRFLTENYTSPAESAQIYNYLYKTAINNTKGPLLEAHAAQEILEIMKTTSFDDRVHSGLGKEYAFAHKIGNWGDEGSWHDCGIAIDTSRNNNNYIICVMSQNTTYEEFLEVTKKVGEFIS